MSAASAIVTTLRRSTWPAGLALALAIMLAAFALVKIIWLLLAGPALPQVSSESVSLPTQAAAPRGSVSQWHLFGNGQAPMIDAKLTAAKETTLKLTLRGTLNESAPDGGLAIIADETGADASYRVGDTLPGGGLLKEIHQGRVLFLREGVAESLSLPRDPANAPAVSSRATPNAAFRPKAPALPGMAVSDMSQIGKIGSIAPNIAPGLPSFESLRAATGIDPAQLARQVQVFPVFANGRMRGVRLAAGRDSSLLESTGLKPTDLITSVNGIPLDGPARQSQLVASLGQGRVEVELERDGKPMKLVIGL